MHLHSHHVPGGREADSHPSLSLSLHVDVEDPRITSIGVDSNETGAVGHTTSFWGAESQAIGFWVTHLVDNKIVLLYHTPNYYKLYNACAIFPIICEIFIVL